jgi:serine/threonine protein kinase/class 3 adenylate cyclase
MKVGPYQLGVPLADGAGFRFHGAAPDGTGVELRLLTRTKAVPAAWATLTRRLRFLALVDHPAVLKPIAVDADHNPPYLTIKPSTPIDRPSATEVNGLTATLSGLVAEAHRLGWTLGPGVSLSPRRTTDGHVVVDWTGTDSDHPLPASEPTPDDDRARLNELFTRWGCVPPPSEMTVITDAIGEADDDLLPPPRIGLRIGDRLGRFTLRDHLGEGGMGTVFLADDPVDGTVVALKVLRPDAASSESARRRFLKEARLLSALNSPYVTRMIEANTDGGHVFLAIEYVDGESVGRKLRRGVQFDEPTALRLIADAARGVATAHAAGIVHRDLKPDNLLVPATPGNGPVVKVVDFGLARHQTQTESMEITRAGTVLGTPLYMPPEQFGSGAVDGRADVYSLGATLYHLLAGRPPVQGDTITAIARSVATEVPPPLDRLNPDLSAATAALVARCLAKNPADRPPDATALLRDLVRILDGEPTDAAAHPLAPPDDGTAQSFTFTWELRATPDKLWPFVSNTERLNKAVGLPAVKYELRKGDDGLMHRFASARVVGFGMDWEERPFEWVEGRRMGVLREYTRGPFEWFFSVVELVPSGTGTTLKHTLRAKPRGLIGKLAGPIEIGRKAKKQLDRVYRRIDRLLGGSAASAEDSFEEPVPSSKLRKTLKDGGERLKAAGANPAAVSALLAFLETAPDQEVASVRPFALARKVSVDDLVMADACLRAVGAGLLQLGWDVICPACRLASARRDTLKELKDHESCQACDVGFQPDFAQSVELVFRVHPDVRPAEVGRYCAGGPAHSPHVVAQVRLTAGERVELDLALSPGRYRIRGPQLPWTLDVPVTAGALLRRWELSLAAADRPPVPSLADGGQVLVIRNDLSHDTVVRVERTAGRSDALTAARAMTLPAFRELFPDELLSPGHLARASAVTLAYVGLDDSNKWFEEVGEAQAFQSLQAGVQRIERVVKEVGGSVVKTVGESVLVAFDRPADAVQVAQQLVENDLPNGPGGGGWKAGIHLGLTRVATVNDRLDYFGHAVKLAARLFDVANAGEVVLSAAVTNDSGVFDLIRSRRVRLAEVTHGKERSTATVIDVRAIPPTLV